MRENMETRKVQMTGGTTLIVSLPKSWANKVNLKGGEEVSLIPQSDGSLAVRARNVPEVHYTKTIFIEGKDGDNLIREIIGAYIAGFNSIELKANKILARQRDTVRKTVNMLIGPEIIEETSDKIVLQDVLNPAELSVKKSIKRMFMITSSHAGERDHRAERQGLRPGQGRRGARQRSGQAVPARLQAVPHGHAGHLHRRQVRHVHGRAPRHAPLLPRRWRGSATTRAKICHMVELRSATRPIPEEIVQEIEEVNGLSMKIVERCGRCAVQEEHRPGQRDLRPASIEATERIRKIDESLPRLNSDVSVPLGIILDSIDRVCDYGCNIAEIAINSAVSSRP